MVLGLNPIPKFSAFGDGGGEVSSHTHIQSSGRKNLLWLSHQIYCGFHTKFIVGTAYNLPESPLAWGIAEATAPW